MPLQVRTGEVLAALSRHCSQQHTSFYFEGELKRGNTNWQGYHRAVQKYSELLNEQRTVGDPIRSPKKVFNGSYFVSRERFESILIFFP